MLCRFKNYYRKSIKDKFVKRFAERAEKMTIGNSLENYDMGPLVSEKHMNDVLKYVELGKSEGATLVCGGYRYTEGECGKGFFVKQLYSIIVQVI